MASFGCFVRNRRAEGVILYQDKPILGLSRVYLLEENGFNGRVSFNGRVLEMNIANQISRHDINQLRRAELNKDKPTLTQIMDRTGMKYAIIDQGNQ